MTRGIKIVTAAGLIAAAVITSGMLEARKPKELREETYIVQRGDTLWTIAEKFVDKNTYGPRYMPEYLESIKENNQWLVERRGMIYPGDKLKITYFVRAE